MKLKYYLRGLGIGIIVTTVILMISFGKREAKLSDEEIISRAEVLGMVMPEESSEIDETNTPETDETEPDVLPESEQEPGIPEDTQAGDMPQVPEDTQVGDMPQVPEDTQIGDIPPESESEPEIPEDTSAGTQQGAAGQDGVPTQAGEGIYRLVIEKGDVCRIVCEKLAAAGVVSDAEALRRYLFEIGYASNISVGMYDIPYGAANEEIASILQAGPLEIEN